MKTWHRIAIAVLAGLGVGIGGAWLAIRQGFSHGKVANGPWSTALNYGRRDADDVTRAAVALRGLLALPASETLYWNALNDSEGKPLDGSCSYTLSGAVIPARWWSVTYYDKAGYLVANDANIWSVSSASIPPSKNGAWQATISPNRAAGLWLPSAKGQGFELTLRMYNPSQAFRASVMTSELPAIKKGECR
jgi:hypothetical protein